MKKMRVFDWLNLFGLAICFGSLYYMNEYSVSSTSMLILAVGLCIVLFCAGDATSTLFGWGEIDDAKRVDALWQKIKKFFKSNKP